MKYIIYLTTNKENGIIYIGLHKTYIDGFDGYIGCGVNINKPATYLNPTTAFQFAVKKYGPNAFERKTLYEFDDIKEALKKEGELVDYKFISQNNNYNMTIGGVTHPDLASNYVYQFSTKGNLIQKFCINEAVEAIGGSINSLYTAIQFKERLKGFYWSRTETINIQEFSTPKEKQKTYRYNSEGKLINIYESITEAAKDINYSESQISQAIKCQQLIQKQWYYSNVLYDKFIKSPKKSLRGSKFYLYDLKGNYIKTIENAENLMKELNTKSWAYLSKAIHHKNGLYKNYIITTEYYEHVTPKENTFKKAVNVYDLQNNLIDTCESEMEACRKYQCRISQVNRVLRGLAHTTKGYIFKWKVNDIV